MIEFDAIVIEGFMPFVGSYEIALDSLGLVFIVGENQVSRMADSNGSGKTAIFDAFSWVHYDRILRGTTADRMINEHSKQAVVESYFRIGTQAYCTVREQRGRTRRWELFSLRGETRHFEGHGDQVEALFGLSFKAFHNTLLFGVSETSRFAAQSDAPRKQLFDELLDLTLFMEKRKLVDAELKHVMEQYDQVERRLGELRSALAAVQQEIVTIDVQREQLRQHSFQKWFAVREKQLQLYRELDKTMREYLRAYATRAEEQAVVDGSTEAVALRTQLTNRQRELERRIDQLDSLRYEVIEQERCPMCQRPVAGAEEEIIRYFKLEADPLAVEKIQLRHHITTLDRVLQFWPTLDPQGHYDAQRRACREIINALHVLEHESDQLQEERFMRQALDEIHEHAVTLTKSIAKEERALQSLQDARMLREFWVEGFGHRGLKGILLREYEQFIMDRLLQYTEMLTAGELRPVFRTGRTLKSGETREEIDFNVTNRYGATCYDDLSSGEKQRVDLGVVLTLQDLVRELHRGRFSLALYDEVFDHLDETGCEQIMAFLTEQRRAYGSVFVISQNPKLLSYPCDHVIRVVKTKKGSAIHVD